MTIEQIAYSINSATAMRGGTRRLRDAIDALSHADRREVQKLLGEDTHAPRNLFYDYDLQQWI